MNYRRDIDGLRAVAVIPVVLYHAGASWVPGGYVGVDVFFVVSGFLITSIILAEHEGKCFSLVHFYERRARRILPAMFFVVAVTTAVAWLWMTPDELKLYAASVISVVLYLSNFFFWQHIDYFGPGASYMPLLHTWSLAVEEQYYLVYPFAFALLWRFGLRVLVGAIVVVLVTSFSLSQWASSVHPSASFYLAPTRAWELMAGSLAALYLRKSGGVPARANDFAALIGLFLILLADAAYDHNTPFPGGYALVPVAGALMLILFGGEKTTIGRFLSTPLMVWIGLLSYSVYLWHQPLYAFARILGVPDSSTGIFLGLAAMSLVLSYFTWRYVENPFRNRKRLSRQTVFGLAGGATAAACICGVMIMTTDFGSGRWSADELAVLQYSQYPRQKYYRERECFLLSGQGYADFSPACSRAENPPLVVWGDSHAASLHMGLFAGYGGNDNWQFTAASCPPILGLDPAANHSCRELNEGIVHRLASAKVHTVLMAANWRYYANLDDWDGKLENTIASLESQGVNVVLVGSLSQWRPSLPVVIARKMQDSGVNLADISVRMKVRDWSQLTALDSSLAGIADAAGASFAPLLPGLCGDGLCDAIIRDGGQDKLVAWDHSHLTLEGSVHVAKLLIPEVTDRLRFAEQVSVPR